AYDASLAGFDGSPVEGLGGVIRLEGDRLVVDGVTGRFRGAAVSLSGSVGLEKPGRPSRGVSLLARVEDLRVDAALRALVRGEAERGGLPSARPVYRIAVHGLARDEAIEQRLPESVVKTLHDLDPAGVVDVLIEALPPKEKSDTARGRFVAELRAHGLSLDAG